MMTKSSNSTPLIRFLQSFGLYFHQIPDSLCNFAAETKKGSPKRLKRFVEKAKTFHRINNRFLQISK